MTEKFGDNLVYSLCDALNDKLPKTELLNILWNFQSGEWILDLNTIEQSNLSSLPRNTISFFNSEGHKRAKNCTTCAMFASFCAWFGWHVHIITSNKVLPVDDEKAYKAFYALFDQVITNNNNCDDEARGNETD